MKLTFTLALVFITGACFAQKQNVYFLKNNGNYVSDKDSADYYRVVQEPDAGSNLYNVYEYYINGQKKLIGKSSKVSPLSFQGQVASFYPNGKKKQLANYQDSKLAGLFYKYYPNGKIYVVRDYSVQSKDNPYKIISCLDSTGKVLVNNGDGNYIGFDNNFKYIIEEGNVKNGLRDGEWKGADDVFNVSYTEHYDNGTLSSGISIDASGNQHTYQQRIIRPYYRDGQKALYEFIVNEINFMRQNILSNVNGTAYMTFAVVPGGKIEHIKILNSTDESMNNTLTRIITMTAKKWEPALVFGMPIKYAYTLPLSLKSEAMGDTFN